MDVQARTDGPVLVITLDRPKANAIDVPTSQALYAAFDRLRREPGLRVGILTGAGERFFSAGWDLKAAADGEGIAADHGPGGFAGLTEFFDIGKPVIAAVNGLALGGGFELSSRLTSWWPPSTRSSRSPRSLWASSPTRAACSGCRPGCRARSPWSACSPAGGSAPPKPPAGAW
jgi:hypothetical protein